jgi:hypothetical protein
MLTNEYKRNLKQLAEAAQAPGGHFIRVDIHKERETSVRFREAATPSAVLALLEENAQLRTAGISVTPTGISAGGHDTPLSGLTISHKAMSKVEALAKQMERAGIPQAHAMDALELMVIYPVIASQLLEGNCHAYICEDCRTWAADYTEATGHEGFAGHAVRMYNVPKR